MQTTFIPSIENQLSEYVYSTPIAGLLFVSINKFADDRGFYAELARIPELEKELQKQFIPQQINLSHSKKNVIRGLHAENWNKLLTITRGSCFCAWADIRTDSPTFGKVVTMTMGMDEDVITGSMFVSAGIANSFLVLSDTVDYVYTVDALYADRDTSDDVAISVFDPELAIDWPVPREEMVISQRDKDAVLLRQKYPHLF